MTKILTFRKMLFTLLLAACSQVSFAQVPFWTETFSDVGEAYNNWEQEGTNDGLIFWEWTDVLDAGNYLPGEFTSPTGSTGYMWFDSDANGELFPADLTLTGRGNTADCTGKSNVHFRFYSYFRTFTGTDIARVGVSTDGVNFTYHNVPEFDALLDEAANGPQVYHGYVDIAIPEADGASEVTIQFQYTGQYEYYWKQDDLELYEYVTPDDDVTFRVNMALETVDPTGVFIAGTFNGGVPELMTDMGSGVWSITKALMQGETFIYAFLNGMTGETVPPACGITTPLGTARSITVAGPTILPAICFSSCGPCVVPCELNPDAIICDNLDSYSTALKLGPQAAWWTTWSGTLGGAEDGIVTTEVANTMPNSFKIISTAANGGPQDVVLNLGNKTTGNYELKWKTFVPNNKNGYYNIQNVVPIGAGAWNLDVFFENAGSGHFQIGGGPSLGTFSYPNEQWFEVRQTIDLDNNFLSLWIDGVFVTKMAYAGNLGGIDYFGTNNISTYYVDDIEYVALPAVVYNVDVCDAAVDLTSYLGAAAGVAQTTGLYDNTTATASPSDPAVTCWSDGPPGGDDLVDLSMWYTFTGDGQEYHIETVPCNATNYIGTVQDDIGDTQMLIYSGDNCDDLTEIACSDDLFTDGVPDWRAGLDLQTEPGVNYYMLIDGFNLGGVIAMGEFCVEITQIASVTCADGVVGTYDVPNPYVCFNGQLADIIFVDDASFVLPTEGPIAGMAWALSSTPVPANTWPSDDAGYLGSTGFLGAPFAVGLTNNGAGFPFNFYYITPVVLGAGTLIDPNLANQIQNVDPNNGCFFVGTSTLVALLPQLNPITATATVGNGSIDLTPAGGLPEAIGDPSLYLYTWSNGATTQDLSGVSTGTYTCTVTDPSGCATAGIVTATVLTSATNDPAAVQSFTISPNPTTGTIMVNLSLVSVSDVRIEVLNTLGQTMQNFNVGKVNALNQAVELGNLAQGSYFLRVTVDGETAIRRVILQH